MTQSRIPPSLLYLTIYNPTLKPAHLDPDNEDAEEQAHILFYTAREHAVSRDRILRQIGLAKALVNFSEMFNAEVSCENVHSQTRRMVMFSPEPNFWMHACYEVAKTPRAPPTNKSKGEAKGNAKGKGKESQTSPPVVYDYHDGSLHDTALRAHLRRGYEEFKLLHGSFSSILSSPGQQALELQLERFFTVFAWKWDPDGENFGTHLGLPRHPLHAKLAPLLDQFVSILPEELMAFALIPPYVIPSHNPRYPAALVRYILARIPPPPPSVPQHKRKPSWPPESAASITPQKPSSSGHTKQAVSIDTGLMGLSMPPMPTMPNMNFNLDVKNLKWGWPGYLTFGKGGNTKGSPGALIPSATATSLADIVEGTQDPNPPGNGEAKSAPARTDTLDVDTASLLEAISSESVGSYTRAASPAPSALSRSSQLGEISPQPGGNTSPVDASPVDAPDTQADGVHLTVPGVARPPPSLPLLQEPRPARDFFTVTVQLASSEDVLKTEKKRVLHLTQGECTIAVVANTDQIIDVAKLAGDCLAVIGDMQAVISEEARLSAQQIPSAAKILQPKDKYIVLSDEYTTSGAVSFDVRSEHLYNGQELLRSGLDVLEVFSRGQNPQHWFIGKRGLGATADGRQLEGEAYMEVARKETTLTDVDNALAGVLRRFDDHM